MESGGAQVSLTRLRAPIYLKSTDLGPDQRLCGGVIIKHNSNTNREKRVLLTTRLRTNNSLEYIAPTVSSLFDQLLKIQKNMLSTRENLMMGLR